MSEESDFRDDTPLNWIHWFCSLDDHQFFCPINEDFISHPFNLYGLNKRIKNYKYQLSYLAKHSKWFFGIKLHVKIKLKIHSKNIHHHSFLEIYQEATELYGLVHARFITSPEGLAIMRERYLSGKFGTCPRVLCEKQNAIPIGISEDSKIARVKIYCPRCKDIFSPKKKFADVDGCYFGTSFPHLLLMVFLGLFRLTLILALSSRKNNLPRPSLGLKLKKKKKSRD